MVVIRLQPIGKKDDHSYRIVVTDSRKPVSGDYICSIGNYYKHAKQADDPWIVLDLEAYDLWVSKGAKPSETVASLAKRYRRDRSFNSKIKKLAVPAAHKKSIRKQRPFPKESAHSRLNPLEEFAWVCRWLVNPSPEIKAIIVDADVTIRDAYLLSIQAEECALLACDVLAKYLDVNCLVVDRDNPTKHRELLCRLISAQLSWFAVGNQLSQQDQDHFGTRATHFIGLILHA